MCDSQIPVLVDQILTISDLKRELLSAQVRREIVELAHPTALQRFGAPFKSEFGEVAPVDSELPILRFIFVNHVRNFPFLDQAREKEFWQDRLQVVRTDYPRREGMLTKLVVSRVIRKQEYILLRRPTGRNQTTETGQKVRETGRTHDGVGHSHRFGLRGTYKVCGDGDCRPRSQRKGSAGEHAGWTEYQ